MIDFKCKEKLRTLQQAAMEAVVNDIKSGHKKVMIVAPTGLGKTAITGGLSKYFIDNQPNSIVLIASHLGLLIEQSSASFMRFWGLATDVLQARRLPSPDSRCVLTTVQSSSQVGKIYAWKESLDNGNDITTVMLDEVHINSGTKRINKLMSFFPTANYIGFTGSPFKRNRDMTCLFDKVSFSVSLEEAIQTGLLVPPKLNAMPVEDKKNTENIMAMCLNIVMRRHSQHRCVVFMRTIDDAVKMRDVFRKTGFSSEAIVSTMDGGTRDKILKDCNENRHNAPQILVTVDVLSVGADIPSLMAIIMPYGTGSVATYLQRIGRGLRLFRGKSYCSVYVGGPDPKIIEEQYEQVTRKAMKAGKRCDNIFDDFELNKGVMTNEEYKLTLDMMKLYKRVKDKGLSTLADMVAERRFPKELMKHLVKTTATITNHNNTAMTDAQRGLLERNKIQTDGLNRNEASAIIDALAKAGGWGSSVPEVPEGKWKGKPATSVPWSYISMVCKTGSKYYNKELHGFFRRTRGVK